MISPWKIPCIWHNPSGTTSRVFFGEHALKTLRGINEVSDFHLFCLGWGTAKEELFRCFIDNLWETTPKVKNKWFRQVFHTGWHFTFAISSKSFLRCSRRYMRRCSSLFSSLIIPFKAVLRFWAATLAMTLKVTKIKTPKKEKKHTSDPSNFSIHQAIQILDRQQKILSTCPSLLYPRGVALPRTVSENYLLFSQRNFPTSRTSFVAAHTGPSSVFLRAVSDS